MVLDSITLNQNQVTCNPYIEISLRSGANHIAPGSAAPIPKHTATDWEITDMSGSDTVWSSLQDSKHLTAIKTKAH